MVAGDQIPALMEAEDHFCLCYVSVTATLVQERSPVPLSVSRNRMDHVYLAKEPHSPLGSGMRIGACCFEPLQAKINLYFFDSELSVVDIILTI